MERPGRDPRGRTSRSADGSTEISLSFPADPDYVPPPPKPEPGPLPDWLRPHVDSILGDMQPKTPVKLQLGYYPDDELEHFGVVLFTEADGTGFGFGVVTNSREADLQIALAEGLQEHFSELREAWGQARPPCPGHMHPLIPIKLDAVAWWACPSDETPIARIGMLFTRR